MLLHSNIHGDDVQVRMKRAVWDIIPHVETDQIEDKKNDEVKKKIDLVHTKSGNLPTSTYKMYRNIIAKLRKEKIRKWIKKEEENKSTSMCRQKKQKL